MTFKIYTKTGDKGKTSLIGGTRVPKYHLRIEAYGTIDELNSYIGVLKCDVKNLKMSEILSEIQDRLFTIGSQLANDSKNTKMQIPDLIESDIKLLEKEIDRMEKNLPALKNFILPGGTQLASFCHVARCVCRRAERLSVQLSDESTVSQIIIKYLNRLSDYLFVLSRNIVKDANAKETEWRPRKK